MSHKLPVISGEDLVKYLAKQEFEIKRQTASHVVVQMIGGSSLFCSIGN
jgi:predicted RNA binding protein YcfA (HicA-like mRNA interferase family)